MENTMEELRRIRNELNVRYMALTPEQRREELDEAVKRYEAFLGHRMPRINDAKPEAA